MTNPNAGETITLGTITEPTEITTFGDGEFLHVDTAGQERAVVWSTSTSLAEIVELVSRTDEIVADGEAAIGFIGEDAVSMTPARALGLISGEQSASISDVWLPFRDFVLSWTRATDSRFAEAAMVFPHANPDVLDVGLIEQTGTDALKAQGRKVLARSAILSAKS